MTWERDNDELGVAALVGVATVDSMVMEALAMMVSNIAIHRNSPESKGKKHIRQPTSGEAGQGCNFSGHPCWEAQGKWTAHCGNNCRIT